MGEGKWFAPHFGSTHIDFYSVILWFRNPARSWNNVSKLVLRGISTNAQKRCFLEKPYESHNWFAHHWIIQCPSMFCKINWPWVGVDPNPICQWREKTCQPVLGPSPAPTRPENAGHGLERTIGDEQKTKQNYQSLEGLEKTRFIKNHPSIFLDKNGSMLCYSVKNLHGPSG